MRGDVSNVTVEETLSKGNRDQDLESQSDRQNLHAYLEQKAESAVRGKCAAQRRLSEAEADMDIINWEQKSSDVALFETIRELESQRLELYQANQWADQDQREKINLCGEFEMKNRLFQVNRARNCQDIEDLRRNISSQTSDN